MENYQKMSYTSYLQRNSSEYIQAIIIFSNQYTSSLHKILNLIIDSIVAFFIICFLGWVNLPLVIILILFFGIIIVTYDKFLRFKLTEAGRLQNVFTTNTIQVIQEAINGFKELRILGGEKIFLENLKSYSNKAAYHATLSASIQAAPRRLLEISIVLFIVIMVVGAIQFGQNPEEAFSLLMMFGIATLRLLPSATTVSSTISQLRSQRFAVSMLYKDFIEFKHDSNNNLLEKKSRKLENHFQQIKISDVKFQYENSNQFALDEISLTINSGESIGIIGSSGSGKTTLLDVLLGLLLPQNGKLFYNGKPLQESINDWCSQVAYLPQEIFLIDNTLRCNVALGVQDSDIDDSLVKKALNQAELNQLLLQLPKGMNTMLGDKGVRLSGGQRQRVALARAFYHKRKILILDEATSSLDHKTEEKIVKEINRLKGHRTLIVIAHRLSTVQYCDRIYHLENGRIVDEGPYDEVIKNNLN